MVGALNKAEESASLGLSAKLIRCLTGWWQAAEA